MKKPSLTKTTISLLSIVVLSLSPAAASAQIAQPTSDYAQPVSSNGIQYAQPVASASDYAQPFMQASPFLPAPKKPQQTAQDKRRKRALARQAYINRVRTAPVGWAWDSILNLYTGGSYSVQHVNSLWQRAPRNWTVLAAAVHYHLPYRLLLGVWGAESGWGQAWNHFGLIGPATGDLRHDAFYSARLFDRFYRSKYGHPAVR